MSDDLKRRLRDVAEFEGLRVAEEAADRIEELEAENQETFQMYVDANEARIDAEAKLATCEKYRDAYAECDRIGTQAVRDLEAKLAKAVEFVECAINYAKTCGARFPMDEACTTLAELTGGKDE